MQTSLFAAALSAVLICGAAAAAERPVLVAQAEAGAKIFHGKGKITGVNAAAGLVTIAHEAIPGLMDAMEMQFEARPAKILDGLKAGDAVTFTLEGKGYKLLEISHAAPGK